MGNKQIIAVVGATGMQGGGLVRAILADHTCGMTVRALTRDVNSDKAKALARLGAEVVAADVHDVESLKRAFAGAAGAFCVTFFWAHLSPEKEFAEAEAMAGEYLNAVSANNVIGLLVPRERINGPMRVRFEQILKHITS